MVANQEVFAVPEACEYLRTSRTGFYRAVAAGLEIRKVGGRTVVLRKDLENFLENAPRQLRRRSCK